MSTWLVVLIVFGVILAWWFFLGFLFDSMCSETAQGRLPQSLSRTDWTPGLQARKGLRICSQHFYQAAEVSEGLGLIESRERAGGPERGGHSFLEYRRRVEQ